LQILGLLDFSRSPHASSCPLGVLGIR